MKLNITRNTVEHGTTYALIIEDLDLVMIELSKQDKRFFENLRESNKISDKLLVLEMIAMKIEEVEQPKSL